MFLALSGPIITLFGVILGAWGTLLMCRAYHPFSTWQMFTHLVRVAGRLLRGNVAGATQSIDNASDFAAVNEENKHRTLAGVYVLVFSFIVQTVGAALIIADLLVRRTQ